MSSPSLLALARAQALRDVRLLWRRRGDALQPALFALLVRDGTTWDAPLSGSPRGDAALPGADEVD